MADIFSPSKRSAIMSKIRSSGTQPEIAALSILRATVGKSRKLICNATDLPGVPDLLVPSLRVALFVDGCFYHCCPSHGHIPKTNTKYWRPKLNRNVRRDRAHRRQLRRLGFSVWRLWEHDLKRSSLPSTAARLMNRIAKLEQQRRSVIRYVGRGGGVGAENRARLS